MADQPAPAFLTTEEAAARIGVTATALRYWRSQRQGPPHVKVGKRALYPADMVERFIQQLKDRASAGASA